MQIIVSAEHNQKGFCVCFSSTCSKRTSKCSERKVLRLNCDFLEANSIKHDSTFKRPGLQCIHLQQLIDLTLNCDSLYTTYECDFDTKPMPLTASYVNL